MTLPYLPGGKDNYVNSLEKILKSVQKENMTKGQLKTWFSREL